MADKIKDADQHKTADSFAINSIIADDIDE